MSVRVSATTHGVPAHFSTTHWSVVLTAGQRDSPEAFDALTHLCQTYWYPLYSYARRRGYGPEDAADLTQDFFARFLQKGYLSHANPERGRFRTFLLTSMKNLLAGEYVRASAVKRGGAVSMISLDDHKAEQRFQSEPPYAGSYITPDRIFDRNWALAVMQCAIEQLHRESANAEKSRLFEALKPFLARESTAGEYAGLAGDLGMTANAVAVAVHRLRERYRDLVRVQVAQTVAQAEEVEEELHYLLSTLVDPT